MAMTSQKKEGSNWSCPGPALRFAYLSTSLGTMLATATAKGLCALRFCHESQRSEDLAELKKQFPRTELKEDPDTLRFLLAQVEKVLEGRLPAARVPLDLAGTPFQKRVWQKLLEVPWGQTLSYSDLARQVGKPRAVRAVASACARNPIVFIIPCHRILRKGGGLGGYYWGLQMKQELLDREKKSPR